MKMPFLSKQHLRAALRTALGYDVSNGLSVAVAMLLISSLVHFFFGQFAAAAATVGVIVVTPPDRPAPKRGKFWKLLPAALIGPPIFLAGQLLQGHTFLLGGFLILITAIAFLGGAWGNRGLPISISVMLAMIFSIAVPSHGNYGDALLVSLYVALGSGLFLVYATLANTLLNRRYRVQMLADTLLKLANLMRTQAIQFVRETTSGQDGSAPLIGQLMCEQAVLADHLQVARNILLESPNTVERQKLAGILMQVLEMRDHLLACVLDLDTLQAYPGSVPLLSELCAVMNTLASEVDQLADALLIGRQPPVFASLRPTLASLRCSDDDDSPAPVAGIPVSVLSRGMANRVGHINDEVFRMIALARGEAEPDLVVVRAAWRLFVTPADWSWEPFVHLWHRNAPPLRHAIRASLAVAAGYAFALFLPWAAHINWILLTIVVVLRGSLAQTVERRNSRVAGTLIGCLLAGAILFVSPSSLLLLVVVTLAQGVSHAFAVRRYVITAAAASVLCLIQTYMLNAGSSPVFDAAERVADTLIGVAIAWGFSYVLPTWERTQIPSMIKRTLAAQARHAQLALGLLQLQSVDNEPELQWRLARREAYDSLSALVQATMRSLLEPRAFRPPLVHLERLLAHSYQLLAQLTAVKTLLLLCRDRLRIEQIRDPLLGAAESIGTALSGDSAASDEDDREDNSVQAQLQLPDPFENDLSPWLLRRLDLAVEISVQVRRAADQTLRRISKMLR